MEWGRLGHWGGGWEVLTSRTATNSMTASSMSGTDDRGVEMLLKGLVVMRKLRTLRMDI